MGGIEPLVQLRKRTVAGARRAAAQFLDRWYGVRTVGNVQLNDLGIDPKDRVEYAPSGWPLMRRIAKFVPFTPADTFVDFGSGKGRVVLIAAQYPFRRVVGIEIAPQLTAIAKDNISRRPARLACRSLELITADATEVQIPADMTIAYFYSPFTGPVFQKVLDNIAALVEARIIPRLWVILVRPTNSTSAEHFANNDNYLATRPWLSRVTVLETKSLSGWVTITSIYCLRAKGEIAHRRTLPRAIT